MIKLKQTEAGTGYKMVVWGQRTFFKLADICFAVRNWLRALNQLQASPDQLSSLRSFVWIPLWHSGQFLARVQPGSEYKMTTSAVSFLCTTFFFVRLKVLAEYSHTLLSLRLVSSHYRIPCWLWTSLLRKHARKVSNAV